MKLLAAGNQEPRTEAAHSIFTTSLCVPGHTPIPAKKKKKNTLLVPSSLTAQVQDELVRDGRPLQHPQ